VKRAGVVRTTTCVVAHDGLTMPGADLYRDRSMQALRDAIASNDEAATLSVLDSLPAGLLDQEFGGASTSTPLALAAMYGYAPIVRALLSRGAAADKVSAFGWTPLIDACARNRVDCAELLIEARADFDRANDLGYTSLFYACMKGYMELAKLSSARLENFPADKALNPCRRFAATRSLSRGSSSLAIGLPYTTWSNSHRNAPPRSSVVAQPWPPRPQPMCRHHSSAPPRSSRRATCRPGRPPRSSFWRRAAGR
jgi:hypothetical protein